MRQMPGPPERDRIERALFDLCMERTYAEVTLSTLVERAGVSVLRFEIYYADLDDCFCSIYRELREEFMSEVGSAFATGESWRERMRAAAIATYHHLRDDPERARMAFVEVLYASDRAKLIRDEGFQWLFALIDQGRLEPGAPADLTPFTAETIGSAAYQRMQVAIGKDEPEAFDEGLREMMYMIVLPYLGEDAAREELAMTLPDWSEGAWVRHEN
jgi:AcrR family transcriptional regulator